MKTETITEEFLNTHQNHIFVFGDNLLRYGSGGAAKLRHLSNTYGFVTKKAPNTYDSSYYKPNEYKERFNTELIALKFEIESNPDKIYLITPLGSGLANKYHIWEEIIKDNIVSLKQYSNVKFTYSE